MQVFLLGNNIMYERSGREATLRRITRIMTMRLLIASLRLLLLLLLWRGWRLLWDRSKHLQ